MSRYRRCDGAIWGTDANDYHQSDEDATDGLCAKCRAVMLGAEAKRPTSWEIYALQRGDHFEHFYPSTIQLQLCGSEPMFLVRLVRDETGPYWGWYHSFHPGNRGDKGQIAFIYGWKGAVEMCFPYGPAVEVKRSLGEIVRLRAEIIRPAVHPEGLPVNRGT